MLHFLSPFALLKSLNFTDVYYSLNIPQSFPDAKDEEVDDMDPASSE